MKKCENCRFFVPLPGNIWEVAKCLSPDVVNDALERDPDINPRWVPYIMDARSICDREGDGRFVHFEPRDPSAGAVAFRVAMNAAAGGSR